MDGCAFAGLLPARFQAAAANIGPVEKANPNRSSSLLAFAAHLRAQTAPPHVLVTVYYPSLPTTSLFLIPVSCDQVLLQKNSRDPRKSPSWLPRAPTQFRSGEIMF